MPMQSGSSMITICLVVWVRFAHRELSIDREAHWSRRAASLGVAGVFHRRAAERFPEDAVCAAERLDGIGASDARVSG
jgi:hypothetical protein